MDRAEPSLVLGTAGHIDHGKTALVRALTGVDTDRLPQEKARGITIELGFAPLVLEGAPRLSVVDVPGHEALVRTMVAGASGIDLLLLVVAADEGVMPQTREHLAICELLGVSRGVVALTKTDATSADLAGLAEAEVEETLAASALAGLPIVRCSAQTGDGLPELREALAKAARSAPPCTPRGGPPRLPVDRAFAMRGFGAVVTGTLQGAPLAVGDAVEVLPEGLAARVRGLQRHGEAAEQVAPGARCAVNLQGVELAKLSRGQVVTRPGALAPTLTLDVWLHWLDDAPASSDPVSVEILLGTAERRAHLAPIGAERLVPGAAGFARIHLEGAPLPALPGDRFIARGFARTARGGSTLGGGVVLDAAPPRRRRADPALRRELETFRRREPGPELAARIARRGLAGAARDRLLRETGLAPTDLDAELAALATRGEAVATASGHWLSAAALAELEARLERALDAWQAAEPLQPGMPAAALRGRLPENVPADAAALAAERLAARGAVVVRGDRVARPGHRVKLEPAAAALAERILARARAAGLEPPSLRDWATELGLPEARLQELLAHLEREGALVRAGSLHFDHAAVDALRERVVAHLRAHRTLDTPTYKSLIGTSRRTAVPLMELFDAEHLTHRRGPHRTLAPSGKSTTGT